MTTTAGPFEGFMEKHVSVKSSHLTDEVEIYVKVGGSGPALLLLHGFPQTHR